MKDFLVKHNFEKRLEYLKRKFQNKTILIYGTGKLFKAICENYDLSGLNIIGVTDIKYTPDLEGKLDFGYKIIPYNKYNLIDVDCILIATQHYFTLETKINRATSVKYIQPLVKFSIVDKFIYKLKQIQFINRLLNSKNNTFVLIKANGQKIYNPKIKNLEVKFFGENNYLEIHEPFYALKSVYISCWNNCRIVIGKNNQYYQSRIIMGTNNVLQIGDNTTIEEARILQKNSFNNKIIIGSDCQISYEIIIRSTDGHTIYDKNTREVKNYARDVVIGDHVWIGARAMILKGSHIPSNSMVGACSLVNKEFTEENTVIAGVSAKIIKKDVNWDRRGPHEFN